MPGALGGDGVGSLVAVDAVEAVVGEVGKDHAAAGDGVGAAAIFVDTVADIKWRRRQIGRSPTGIVADKNRSSRFRRARFQPIDVVAINNNSAEANRAGNDQVGRDRGVPGAVWGDGRRCQVTLLQWCSRETAGTDPSRSADSHHSLGG